MAFEKRDLSGALFKNQKPMSDKSANLTGNAIVDGVEYWVSGWTKTRDNGEKWISMSFKRKEAPTIQASKATSYDLDDDSIPF
jgi:hypothetical protein